MRVIIVGGVAGGATAAARLRRLDENAEIIIFERSGFISYANCGLPYYIGGVIEDKKELTLQTPDSLWRRYRIDVRVHHEVTVVDPGKKTVTVKDLDTGRVFEESYDKLILATGAKPTVPQMTGAELENVFSLRTVEDTLKIRAFVENRKPKTVVIAGGGYIGIEMAENLSALGMDVTIVQRPAQLMPPLDADMASLVHAKMRRQGVKLKFGSSVIGFEQDGEKVNTLLKDECPLKSDMVILAIGITPDTTLAKEAGLALGIKGSIIVNEKMETSAQDVYAVGDAVQVKQYVTGEDALISLAGPANKQGRIAADNICGIESTYDGSMGSSVVKLFDMTIATTGLNEKSAKTAGIEVEKIVISHASHAGYYPGAKTMFMKVLCDKSSRKLIGAQIIGYDGVDKRIDVIATAIQCGMTGPDLKKLDLAYAPPFSSAKDPVNMAGFVFENVFSGIVKQFHFSDIATLPRDGSVTLLDTRTDKEYNAGHAEGFMHIPVDDLRERLDEVPSDKPVYVMCQSGIRSYISCRILTQNGYDCYNFSGGYSFYNTVFNDVLASKETYPCGMEK